MSATTTADVWNSEVLGVTFHGKDTSCSGAMWTTLSAPRAGNVEVCVTATSVPSSNTFWNNGIGVLGTRSESTNLTDFTSRQNNTASLEDASTKLCSTGVAVRFYNESIFGKKGAFCLATKEGQPTIRRGVKRSWTASGAASDAASGTIALQNELFEMTKSTSIQFS